MADESQGKPPTPEDSTVVKAHNRQDATVVEPAAVDDDATVMAGHGSSLESGSPTDGEGAMDGDDATRVNIGPVPAPSVPGWGRGDTFTLGSATVTVSRSPGGPPRSSAANGVALGVVTGLVAFALTAWWLLHRN